ncbi:hypothetical protein R3P38DRAFT_3070327, partial [Favolaschia claudopus]
EEKLSMMTEICGSPGYMAPEIFLKTGHSKPVDIWAMGVVTSHARKTNAICFYEIRRSLCSSMNTAVHSF